MFHSPSVRIFTQQNQENSDCVIAKKPGTFNVSTRKPLADRSVNQKYPNKTSELQFPDIKKKPHVQSKPLEIKSLKTAEHEETEFFIDEFSGKDVEDTYEDIWAKKDRLNESDICRIIESLSGKFRASTPPMKTNEYKIIPSFVEQSNVFDISENDHFEVSLTDESDLSVPNISLDDLDF